MQGHDGRNHVTTALREVPEKSILGHGNDNSHEESAEELELCVMPQLYQVRLE